MLRQATSCRSMSWCQRWNDSSCGHGECTIAARWISGGFKWCFTAGIVPYVSSLEWQLYMEVTDATAGWVQLSGKAAGRVGTVPPSLFGTAFWSGFLTSRPGLGFLFPVSASPDLCQPWVFRGKCGQRYYIPVMTWRNPIHLQKTSLLHLRGSTEN